MWITREHDDEDNRGSRGEENVDITSKSPLHSVKLVARNIILPAPFRLRQKPSPRGNLGFRAMRYFLGTLNGICNFIFLACERVLVYCVSWLTIAGQSAQKLIGQLVV